MRAFVGVGALLCALGGAGQAAETKPDRSAGDPRAAALLEQGSKSRYVWSTDVRAVSGEFTWDQDGKTGRGSFHDTLHERGGLKITGENGSPVPEEIRDHIASMIGHRVPASSESAKRPPAAAVIVVEDEEHGPLIMKMGDRFQSSQRIKDGKLVQVNRTMGDKRFSIDITRFDPAPDGRVYASDFTVTWWDAGTGKRTEKQTYTTEGFYTIDGQLFPKVEKVVSEKDGKSSTLEIQYSKIKFDLPGQKAAAK